MAVCSAISIIFMIHLSTSNSLATRYSNSFAVGVQGGRDKADEIAAKHGFTNMGPVSIEPLYVCY